MVACWGSGWREAVVWGRCVKSVEKRVSLVNLSSLCSAHAPSWVLIAGDLSHPTLSFPSHCSIIAVAALLCYYCLLFIFFSSFACPVLLASSLCPPFRTFCGWTQAVTACWDLMRSLSPHSHSRGVNIIACYCAGGQEAPASDWNA